MIEFLGIGFRIIELGVVAAALLVAGLLFIRSRPAGLVWVSALAMTALAAHLFLEQGRWQMIPLYAVIFAGAIWLAVPSRRPYRGGGLALRLVLLVAFVVPSLLLPIAIPIFVVPSPDGSYGAGMAQLLATMPEGASIPLTVHYPTDSRVPSRGRFAFRRPGLVASARSAPVLAPYWTLEEVKSNILPGFPWIASSHLTLVPTNSVLRGHLAQGVFPVALAVRSADSLPSDFLEVVEQAASVGWIVVEPPVGTGPDELVAILESLERGTLDAAFDGVVDTDRAIVLSLGDDVDADIGLPIVSVGGEALFGVVSAGASYGVAVPDLRIPADAFTNRYLLVRPARLLVGSSDVAAGDLNAVIRRLVSALLAPAAGGAPVFAPIRARDALSEAQQAMAGLIPDLTILSRPDER